MSFLDCCSLSSCGAVVSGYMDLLHPAENSVTCLSTPRLMTTHNFVPSPLTESICTSVPCRGWARRWYFLPIQLCFGPRVITEGRILTTLRDNSYSCQQNLWSGHEELSLFHRLRESCFARNLSPALNSTQLFLVCTERSRFLNALSRKAGDSSLVRVVTWSCEMLRFVFGVTLSPSLRPTLQCCALASATCSCLELTVSTVEHRPAFRADISCVPKPVFQRKHHWHQVDIPSCMVLTTTRQALTPVQ